MEKPMFKLKLIGAALALAVPAGAFAAEACCCSADQACCKDGADCCAKMKGKAREPKAAPMPGMKH
jgi:hypothetical protein